MVLDNFPTFSEWFLPGLILFGGIVLAAILLGLFVGYVVASFRHGPFEAFYIVAQVVGESVPDFLGTSPRRVLAMARLAMKEAFRRKVLIVAFAIFAILLLFGQWFMGGTENPEKRFMNTIMFGTQMLTLLTVMLISAFSLPEDIKNKTIYTIVTKPVRATEIILGRILGFGFLGTILLALMGLISFFFVSRNLDHTHLVVGDTQTIASLSAIEPGTEISKMTGKRVSPNAVMEGETNMELGHMHRLEVLEFKTEDAEDPILQSPDIVSVEQTDGKTVYRRLVCLPVGGHTHQVTISGTGDDAQISLGPAIGYFRARIPVYADDIRFLNSDGLPSASGVNVGKESGYRGFIDGGTHLKRSSLSRAIFTYSDFTASRFNNADVIPLEMTLGVFRTYKGDMQKRVVGGLQFASIPDNPEVENRFVSETVNFETNEYQLQIRPISRKVIGRIEAPDGTLIEEGEYDLFDDFAANGKLELSLSCRDLNQYLGVARADMYFRASDDVYWFNYFKGYVGIWCQMMIIIAMAVAFSTFLGTPIVMLGVLTMMIIGFFTPFIRSLTEVGRDGGGPIESFIRILTQKNMQVDLETGVATTLIKESDNFISQRLSDLTYLAPNFKQLDFSEFLTYGYSIDNQRILVALAITLAFCIGLTLLGYFSLKTREIAK
ncbi:ABC transporter permease [Mariniblastus fucicola]|uniref:ABC-2 family transporter protein n=1 Tax=Mariniblastus fucicola TaxID=980251 RepID=A0A5B9P8E8_9BACT|nr:hypothetical protein [Mariniblastus fucicola]QEG21140.1 ABC-2 family transporter protein [Mariniblastus fucicola]